MEEGLAGFLFFKSGFWFLFSLSKYSKLFVLEKEVAVKHQMATFKQRSVHNYRDNVRDMQLVHSLAILVLSSQQALQSLGAKMAPVSSKGRAM